MSAGFCEAMRAQAVHCKGDYSMSLGGHGAPEPDPTPNPLPLKIPALLASAAPAL